MKQLFVDEDHGLLLLRADKGRDGKVCVFALSDFDELSSDQAKTKLDCKEHKLERAKGNIFLRRFSLKFHLVEQNTVRSPHRNK